MGQLRSADTEEGKRQGKECEEITMGNSDYRARRGKKGWKYLGIAQTEETTNNKNKETNKNPWRTASLLKYWWNCVKTNRSEFDWEEKN